MSFLDGLGGLGFGCGRVGGRLKWVFRVGGRHAPGRPLPRPLPLPGSRNVGGLVALDVDVEVLVVDVVVVVVVVVGGGPEGTGGSRECAKELMFAEIGARSC